MKEEELHYFWKYKQLPLGIKTFCGKDIQIIKTGIHNSNAGPDFLEAIISIGNKKWAGQVEIHINSSDWDKHRHSEDDAYQNVILHVVYKHDKEIASLNKRNIPTLEIDKYVSATFLEKTESLKNSKYHFIPCENLVTNPNQNPTIQFWLTSLYLERLENRVTQIKSDLESCENNWEAVLFKRIAYVFGLKVNAEAFISMADSFDFKVLQKNHKDLQ